MKPKFVKIVEVGPRDGLQNEAIFIPTKKKIVFINQLSETGLNTIEVTSFVSPKWIPQLRDQFEVYSGITRKPKLHYPVLIPNVQGLDKALEAGVSEIAIFCSASETFSQKNINCSIQESLNRYADVISKAKQKNLWIRAYISCVIGCPYEGPIAPENVAKLTEHLIQMGCHEISLGDTIGVGTPNRVLTLIEHINKKAPLEKLAVHFHDTYGQALANVYAALERGIAIVDSSISGLGGCPYAKGATGNVATEDVLYLLQGLGIETGVDLKALVRVGRFISELLNRETRSKVGRALFNSWDDHPRN